MPSLTRRVFLTGSSTALLAAGGCSVLNAPSTPAHWVTVYLGDREEVHEVSIAVQNGSGTTLFEKEYRLSDDNEADEDAPFPKSTDPEAVVVTVDGTRFERQWPGFERPELPCDSPNSAGIEVWIENGADGAPTVRMKADCQHVTMN